jgi:hypothetical protein
MVTTRLKINVHEFTFMAPLSPERVRIARIFKENIDRAIDDLGVGYDVTVQGKFDSTPIRIE